jgi:hypothetical protein
LPDLEFYRSTVACQFACPVRTDSRAYVTAIGRGEFERAYLIVRETNPLRFHMRLDLRGALRGGLPAWEN